MKTNHEAACPIGIFDSGIGGLTVAHAVAQVMPHENLVYFGDTAHLPYGDKSTATIQSYAVKIAQMLLSQQCKLILIACNSASAAAYELIKEYVGSKAVVMNVIDPVVKALTPHANQHIGLIGTRQTVNSHIFKKKIDELNLNIQLTQHITNLLASAIEEFGDHVVLDSLLEEYLKSPELQSVDALVLACTHYPIIKHRVAKHFKKKTTVIDTAEIVAHAVKAKLEKLELLNANGSGEKHFYVSDYTETFAANAKLFFDEDLKLEHYPLWD